jgi:uncharacterized protein (TIRG00374 family)
LSTLTGSTWRNLSRWLPGLLISLAAVFLLLKWIDWQEVAAALDLVQLNSLPLAWLAFLLGLSARAVSWQIILQKKAPLGRVFLALNEGYLLNNLFPFRLGELARAILLGGATGLSPLFILSTIVIERSFDLALAAGLVLTTLPLVLGMEAERLAATGALGLVGIGLFALYGMARYREGLKAWLRGWGKRWRLLERALLPRLDALLEGLSALTNPVQFWQSLAWMALNWAMGALSYYLLLRSFVPSAPFWWAGFVVSVAALGVAVPAAPASLGVYEASVVGALSLLGVNPAQALAFSLVAHFLNLSTSTVIGGYALIRDGETLAGLVRRVRGSY